MSSHSNQSSPQSLQALPLGGGEGLRICVLQPDYSTSTVDYQKYDPPRDLSSLIPNASFTHIFLNKLTTYKQLKELSKQIPQYALGPTANVLSRLTVSNMEFELQQKINCKIVFVHLFILFFGIYFYFERLFIVFRRRDALGTKSLLCSNARNNRI